MFEDGTVLQPRGNTLLSTPTKVAVNACTPFNLSSNGVLSLAGTAITLTTNVLFVPQCTGSASQNATASPQPPLPFYASTIPQTYAIAAATVISWVLVIMLIITPRTSFSGMSAAAPGFSSGRGIIGGANGGGTSLIGVGSRPWLQKIAALSAAISLALATAETFKEARIQYEQGYSNAILLRNAVLSANKILITRVISDVFLWLAQVQTLIRLFPRHREKVIIKWVGFALILSDTIFACLTNFFVQDSSSLMVFPGHFYDAIQALSYLFELALGLLYAAWVIYFSLTKRRYAFYHPKMKNICLIALMSLIAVLTPVVFFVTDISDSVFSGWGEFFRWVGAAAASVIVWEWVERIEALEREERKDGILGREIFDGDEMVDAAPSDDVVLTSSPHGRSYFRRRDNDDYRTTYRRNPQPNQSSALEKGLSNVAARFRNKNPRPRNHFPLGRANSITTASQTPPKRAQDDSGNLHVSSITFGPTPRPREGQEPAISGRPTPPPAVASPVSRADTTSAASTVYVVHYHPVNTNLQPAPREGNPHRNTEGSWEPSAAQGERSLVTPSPLRNRAATDPEKQMHVVAEVEGQPEINLTTTTRTAWLSIPNPFNRRRTQLPPEVQAAKAVHSHAAKKETSEFSRSGLKNRLNLFAHDLGENSSNRQRKDRHDGGPLIIIPAQPRGTRQVWSPDDQAKQVEDHSGNDSIGGPITPRPHPRSHGSFVGSGIESSASTTVTTNATAHTDSPLQPSSGFPGSVLNNVNSRSPANSQTSAPPRADDIAPASSPDGPIIIPAPKRAGRNSPFTTWSNSSGPRGT